MDRNLVFHNPDILHFVCFHNFLRMKISKVRELFKIFACKKKSEIDSCSSSCYFTQNLVYFKAFKISFTFRMPTKNKCVQFFFFFHNATCQICVPKTCTHFSCFLISVHFCLMHLVNFCSIFPGFYGSLQHQQDMQKTCGLGASNLHTHKPSILVVRLAQV